MTITWVDCGCCGRTHEDLPGDCRAFANCSKCGDGYHVAHIASHEESCTGVPLSGMPDAEFTHDE